MNTFTSDQKMAMLVVPVLLFSMMGVSYAGAYSRNPTEDEEIGIRRIYPHGTPVHGDTPRVFTKEKIKNISLPEEPTPLEKAIVGRDYEAFVKSLSGTAFYESATEEVFDMLVSMYTLHTNGKHSEAHMQYKDALL